MFKGHDIDNVTHILDIYLSYLTASSYQIEIPIKYVLSSRYGTGLKP